MSVMERHVYWLSQHFHPVPTSNLVADPAWIPNALIRVSCKLLDDPAIEDGSHGIGTHSLLLTKPSPNIASMSFSLVALTLRWKSECRFEGELSYPSAERLLDALKNCVMRSFRLVVRLDASDDRTSIAPCVIGLPQWDKNLLDSPDAPGRQVRRVHRTASKSRCTCDVNCRRSATMWACPQSRTTIALTTVGSSPKSDSAVCQPGCMVNAPNMPNGWSPLASEEPLQSIKETKPKLFDNVASVSAGSGEKRNSTHSRDKKERYDSENTLKEDHSGGTSGDASAA
ncbi:hypothetical protein NMY22_g17149 [Coprinellus aureogranulatus]|nr:hypothetical protein NMY22_g17149 [Coprinellus aureogranulatus]